MALNMGIIQLNMHVLFPMPESMDMNNPEELSVFMATLPVTVFLVTMVAHLGQSFVGGWGAARLGASRPMLLAMIIGVLSHGPDRGHDDDPGARLDVYRTSALSCRGLARWSNRRGSTRGSGQLTNLLLLLRPRVPGLAAWDARVVLDRGVLLSDRMDDPSKGPKGSRGPV
jgi:hypothetical protein